MAKYHVNSRGEARSCAAERGNCPFGGEEKHFETPEQAREFYEQQQGYSFQDTSAKDLPRYRGYAVQAMSELEELQKAQENETSDLSSHLYHKKMVAAYDTLLVAAESARLRATDENEREQWNVTATQAHYEGLMHERAALELQPKDEWLHAREERKRKRAELKVRIEMAEANNAGVLPYIDAHPGAVTHLASNLHDEWRSARKQNEDGTFEERLKDDGEGGQVDIANTTYANLPSQWQEENRAAASSAVKHVITYNGNVELAADKIHQDWLARNGAWAEEHQKLPFNELSEEEKEKDRVLAREALKMMRISYYEN